MSDINKKEKALEVYQTLCSYIDKKGYKHNKIEEDKVVFFDISGEDIPIEFILMVDEERQLARIISRLPFEVGEDKRLDLAIATVAASYKFTEGNFDFDLKKGKIAFRIAASFRGSTIGEGLFSDLILKTYHTVEKYNDKFMAISKGYMSIQAFLEELNK